MHSYDEGATRPKYTAEIAEPGFPREKPSVPSWSPHDTLWWLQAEILHYCQPGLGPFQMLAAPATSKLTLLSSTQSWHRVMQPAVCGLTCYPGLDKLFFFFSFSFLRTKKKVILKKRISLITNKFILHEGLRKGRWSRRIPWGLERLHSG